MSCVKIEGVGRQKGGVGDGKVREEVVLEAFIIAIVVSKNALYSLLGLYRANRSDFSNDVAFMSRQSPVLGELSLFGEN